MKPNTKHSIIVAAFLCAAGSCLAQSYPSKPIRFVVAYPPGGAADLVARVVGPKTPETLGQPAIIENRGGAGGQIGAQLVASAPPDGYTILITVGPTHLISRFTAKSLPYDPVKDFTPITSSVALVLCVAAYPGFPPNNVAELIAYARRNPGKVSFGTTSIGGEAHLSMEYIKLVGGVDMTHVPYKGGGPAATDLVGGHIPLLMLPVSTVMEHVKKGSVKVLGVLYPRRLPLLPQVQTIAEALPGISSQGSWIGVFGPAGMPPPITARLHAAFAQTLNAPETREKLEATGVYVVANTPQQLAEQVIEATALYEKLIKAAKIQPE